MGKIHYNELSTRLSNDLVDLLNLAHPAPMIMEVRDAHTIWDNLLNEFDFHVNKVMTNQAAWNNKRMLRLIPSALALSTCNLSLPQVISSHLIEQPDHSVRWDT